MLCYCTQLTASVEAFSRHRAREGADRTSRSGPSMIFTFPSISNHFNRFSWYIMNRMDINERLLVE